MTSKTKAPARRGRSMRVSRPKLAAIAALASATAGLAGFNAVRARKATRANPPLGEFVTVDGVKLHYLARGSGPTVVLLHGNGLMIEDWLASGVLDGLAEGNRVLAFDRPGFGHSERPRSRLWTPVAQARLIAKALHALGEERVAVVGHSFGTLVALALASEHPELVASMVLISGYYYPSARVDVAVAATPAIPGLGDVMRYTGSPLIGAALRPAMDKQMFAPAPVPVRWRAEFPYALTLRPWQIRSAAADAGLMIPAAATASAQYPGLRVPLTIVAGRGDRVVDHEGQSSRLAGEVEGSELLLISNAGHMVHHSSAEKVVESIRTRIGSAA